MRHPVITGLGIVTATGFGVEATWRAITTSCSMRTGCEPLLRMFIPIARGPE